MTRPSITGIDHVLLSMPRGGEEAASRFYGEVLGLREVPKPPPLDTHGGCWFVGPENPALSIHLGVDDPFVPARKADPFGNRLELIDARDAAFSARDSSTV